MDKARMISQIENAPENMKLFLDLGWANGWGREVPQIVKQCKELGHRPKECNLDPTMHGLDHKVICAKCGYVYHYDSSG